MGPVKSRYDIPNELNVCIILLPNFFERVKCSTELGLQMGR